MDRREFLELMGMAAAGGVLSDSPAGAMQSAGAGEGASIAGQIAVWAGSKLGNQLATVGVNMALGYLGLEPGEDVDSKLDQMNAKLDQILSQLDVLNTKIDQLAASINQLTNDVDIGLKQAYAQISESALVPVFGSIDTKLGSRSNANSSNLYGLMHLPPSGKSGVANAGNTFTAQKQQFWDKIHSIHYTLTVQAGSSESLLQKWASLIIAKMHAKGQGLNLGGYAAVYESWFTQAVGYQLKAYAMVLFCTGRNTANLNTARQEMGGMLAEECAKYLDGLDRMALSLAQVAPSGPITEPLSKVGWAAGTAEWLLRGDVYTAMLNTAFDGDTQTPQAKKISGVYGRVVLRPSDLTPDGKAPDRIAFAQYPQMQSYWPAPGQPGRATLGARTEFQGVDWITSSSNAGLLKAGGQSGLRFGRYFWPTPPHPGQDFRNFEPFGYTYWHWTDRPLQQDPGSNVIIARMRPQGRPGIPTYRSDAKVALYGLADLAPIVLPRMQQLRFTYQGGQPVSVDSDDPYQIFGKTAAFVISWLDGWSGPSNGATFTDGAPSGYQTTDYSGDPVLSCPLLTNTTLSPHLLQFDSGPIRKRIHNRTALAGPANYVDLKGTVRCAWSSSPAEGAHMGSRVHYISLFSTSPEENGVVQIYLRGHLNITQTKSADGMDMSCGIQVLLTDDKGSQGTLYASANSGDFEISSFVGGSGPRPLLPNTAYRLMVRIIPTATFKYSIKTTGRAITVRGPDFSRSGEAEYQVELTITDAAISRPAGTGYQVA